MSLLGLGYIFTYPPNAPFGFLRTNVHKHPVLSKIMCALGRHDYEYIWVDEHPLNAGRHVLMKCFYCEQTKQTNYEVWDDDAPEKHS